MILLEYKDKEIKGLLYSMYFFCLESGVEETEAFEDGWRLN